MAIKCITWETAHLHGESWISHHRLRYRLFIERQNWEVPTYNGLEYDEFDTPAAHYLAWCDENGHAQGTMRLVSTERPYMIEKLWPDLLGGRPLPHVPHIWEASRFGVDRDLAPDLRNRVVGELIAGGLEFGLSLGIRQYLCVMPIGILKGVLERSGCALQLLGDPVHMGRHPVAAAAIAISTSTLAEVRRRRHIGGPVLTLDRSIAA